VLKDERLNSPSAAWSPLVHPQRHQSHTLFGVLWLHATHALFSPCFASLWPWYKLVGSLLCSSWNFPLLGLLHALLYTPPLFTLVPFSMRRYSSVAYLHPTVVYKAANIMSRCATEWCSLKRTDSLPFGRQNLLSNSLLTRVTS
jgi:hypothetical protein